MGLESSWKDIILDFAAGAFAGICYKIAGQPIEYINSFSHFIPALSKLEFKPANPELRHLGLP